MLAYLYIMDYRDKSCRRRGPMGYSAAMCEADDLCGAILAIACAVRRANEPQPTTTADLGCLFNVPIPPLP